MIIEVVGLPGSGKTTAFRILEEHFLDSDVNFYKSGDKKTARCYLLSLVFFCRLIIYYPKSLFLLHRSSRWLVHKLLYRVCSYEKKNQKRTSFLFDSGVLMPIISFFTQRNTDSTILDLNILLKIIPMPDVLLVVEADIENIINRYIKRGGFHIGKSRKNIKYSDELRKDFLYGECVLGKVVSFAKEKNVEVVSINNNLTLKDYKKCLKKLNIE